MAQACLDAGSALSNLDLVRYTSGMEKEKREQKIWPLRTSIRTNRNKKSEGQTSLLGT